MPIPERLHEPWPARLGAPVRFACFARGVKRTARSTTTRLSVTAGLAGLTAAAFLATDQLALTLLPVAAFLVVRPLFPAAGPPRSIPIPRSCIVVVTGTDLVVASHLLHPGDPLGRLAVRIPHRCLAGTRRGSGRSHLVIACTDGSTVTVSIARSADRAALAAAIQRAAAPYRSPSSASSVASVA